MDSSFKLQTPNFKLQTLFAQSSKSSAWSASSSAWGGSGGGWGGGQVNWATTSIMTQSLPQEWHRLINQATTNKFIIQHLLTIFYLCSYFYLCFEFRILNLFVVAGPLACVTSEFFRRLPPQAGQESLRLPKIDYDTVLCLRFLFVN